MAQLIKIFGWGLLISFLGSLPLGTLNVLAMQIGLSESIHNALLFSLGSLLVEMIYVRISLIGINWIRKQARLMKILEWVTLGIVVLLAIGSFAAAIKTGHGAAVPKSAALNNHMNRFLFGAIGCAVNPVVILFWLGWSTVLFTKKRLLPTNANYNFYIVGIGLGAFAGNCVFIFGGDYLNRNIAGIQQYINWIIGGIFALTAAIQLIKILQHKDAVSKLQIEAQDGKN